MEYIHCLIRVVSEWAGKRKQKQILQRIVSKEAFIRSGDSNENKDTMESTRPALRRRNEPFIGFYDKSGE